MPKMILVVDDDPAVLDLLCSALADAGFSTTTAANGLDALEQARSGCPDLLLLDLMLPGMDGFAVCESLRRDPATASLPVVMLTGLPGQLPRLAGAESGATEFFHKPFNPAELINRVRDLLSKRESRTNIPAAAPALVAS